MIRRHRIAATIVTTLALTVSLASTALADPAPLAQGEAAIAATHTGATSTVRPNPDEQTMAHPAAAPARASTAACGDACSGGGYGFGGSQPTAVHVTAASITKPCSPSCETSGQAAAAALGYNRGHDGQASAAALGFDRGHNGQATAAALGFNRGHNGQVPSAALGYNPRPIGQQPGSVVASAHPTTPTSEPAVANGFDWGDAGIGAGGALGLMMLLAGGALIMTGSRQRPTRSAAQPTA